MGKIQKNIKELQSSMEQTNPGTVREVYRADSKD
jgi:hypothetical protein